MQILKNHTFLLIFEGFRHTVNGFCCKSTSSMHLMQIRVKYAKNKHRIFLTTLMIMDENVLRK